MLPNGKVLVVGGFNAGPLASTELYDPSTGTWTPAGNLGVARCLFTATLLPNGKVLVAGGGLDSTSAELFNPATGTWSATGNITSGHVQHTATLLPDGNVLLAGSLGGNTCDLYNPITGTWSTTGNLSAARYWHTATLLPNGKVLAAGGSTGSVFLSSAELYSVSLQYSPASQPTITATNSPLTPNGVLTLTGTQFKGLSEASGGSTTASASNYPIVQLRSLVNEQAVFLSPNPSSTTWSNTTFSTTLNGFPSGYAYVTVFTNGIPSNSVLVLITSGPPTQLSFSTQPGDGVAGSTLSPQPVVTLKDAMGYTVTGVAQNITLAIQNNAGNGTLSGSKTVAVNIATGMATFSGLSINKVGTGYTLTATGNTVATAPGTHISNAFNISAGSAANLVISIQPGSAASGNALTAQPALTLQDAFGNTVTGTAQNVTLALQNNPGNGTLSGTKTVALNTMTGVATFSGLSIDKVGTGYTLTATGDTVSTTPGTLISNPFNITAGAAAKLVFSVQPGDGIVGNALGTQPVVTLKDANENTVTGTAQNVTLAIQSNGGGGTLGGTKTVAVNTATGVATFSDLSIDKTGTGYTLTATGDTVSVNAGAVLSASFSITNNAPSILSGPIATPSTAGVGQKVAFSMAASDADNQALTYTWTMAGNTLTGVSPTYTFVAAGIYTVSVSVSDSYGGTATGSVSVTVKAPIIGTGNDSDGDGFSDDFEIGAGASPGSANDSPAGGLPITVKDLRPVSLSIKLNFAKPANDRISLGGTLPIPGGFAVANKSVVIDIGGVIRTVKMDSKGRSPKGLTSFSIQIKSTKGVVREQNAKFGVKLSRGNFSDKLKDEGLTSSNASNEVKRVAVSLIFGDVVYVHTQPMSYSAKAGKTGSAK